MDRLIDSIPVMILPFCACLVIAGLHCYMGLHVLRRGVIFVDLALAQCAALGAAVALFLLPVIWPETLELCEAEALTLTAEDTLAEELALEDDEPLLGEGAPLPDGAAIAASGSHVQGHAHALEHGHGHGHGELEARFSYALSLLFALLGAAVLSFARFRDERVPHEAIIGIIFVVCAALSVLILSKAPHGHDKMEAMLIGSILFVSSSQVITMAVLYAILGVLHFAFRRQFIRISEDVTVADRSGMKVKLWDSLFFATFALMVTQSVGIAGVFVVFSYLIIPAACGKLFCRGFGAQLAVAWIVAVVTTVAGLIVSAVWDMPTGSSLVSCFGAALVVSSLLSVLFVKGGKAAAAT